MQLYQSIQFCIKKDKNKQTKYNTADQVVDIQAVNLGPMKRCTHWTMTKLSTKSSLNLASKSFVTLFFMKLKIKKLQTSIYYLIYTGARWAFCEVVQHKET